MKILHVYKSYYPHTFGGIEKFIDTLSLNTAAHGIQNELITCAPCENITEKSQNYLHTTYYPITFEKSSCPVSFSFLKHFKDKAQQADLLHFHFPWPFADAVMISRAVKKPYIVTYHSDIIRQKFIKPIYSPLMMHFLKRANKVIATSDNYVQSSEVLKKLNNVSVIPIALDDVFHPSTSQSEKPYFLFVGTLREYKGLAYLVEAMRGVDQFDVIIAGHGPCYAQLKEMIDKYHLTNVKLIGKVNEAQKWALFANAFGVVSSAHLRNEAYCYMLVEGLMFGKPLVSTELNTGTSYVNANGETGIVVPPENPVALREAMVKLVSHRDLAEQYGVKARERFLHFFTAKKMTYSYLQLYREVLLHSDK
jgi:glycosyltransferase involved in cell wall biosynthesis